MRRLVPRHTTRPPDRLATRIPTVCVVDPQADGYEGWQATARARGLRLMFCASAEEALRLARTAAIDLWVINAELPELSGHELCSMLKARSAQTAVYLVANEYSIEAEQSAWQVGATLFGCKPGHEVWLSEWLHLATRPCELRQRRCTIA